MIYLFSFLMVVLSFINCFSGACRVQKYQSACEAVKNCVWDSRGCSVGLHPLEAVSLGEVVEGDTIQDNFNTSYHIEKAD